MTDHDDPLSRETTPRLGLSFTTLLAILIGGGLGTVARFLLDTTFTEGPGQFPTVTLLINLSGSLAIGFLIPLVDRARPRAPLARPFVIVGLLGGWTTYSTLAVNGVTLLQGGHVGTCLLYLVATLAGGIALVAVGSAAGRNVVGA
jgi:fluoride exporter